jgi:hypothetical protein
MLICPSSFEQFNQRINKKLTQLRPRWLESSYETKGMQYKTQTNLKPPISKRHRTKEKHREKKKPTKLKQPNWPRKQG